MDFPDMAAKARERARRGLHDFIGDTATTEFAGVDITYYRHSDYGGPNIRFRVTTEDDFAAEWAPKVQSNDVVWDVGANIGPHTLAFGRLAHNVHAFEPHPQNAMQLRRNVEATGISDCVTVHECALGATDGEIGLSKADAGIGNGTSQIGEGNLVVEQQRGDTLVEDEVVSPPDVVKIDVEGAEERVIEGMSETLADVRVLILEIHVSDEGPSLSDYGSDECGVRSQLRDLGFTASSERERGSTIHVIWTR